MLNLIIWMNFSDECCGGGGVDARDVIHVSNFSVPGGSTVSFTSIIYAVPVVADAPIIREPLVVAM